MIIKKTVLVTGASRGIGRAIAVLFARKNYNVVINYNNSESSAEALVTQLISEKCNVVAQKADVSKKTEVDMMFSNINKIWGNVDILINNAGIALEKLLTDTSESEWKNIFDVNVNGMFYCTQMALKSMIKNHYGKIINISSMWGITGASCEVAYSATKAAVLGFTKALAKEVGPSGINVNAVAPGIIDTEMNKNIDPEVLNNLKEETPLCSIGTALDVAETVFFLASERSKFITGQVISPNGGFVI